jgi:hypothetical protein
MGTPVAAGDGDDGNIGNIVTRGDDLTAGRLVKDEIEVRAIGVAGREDDVHTSLRIMTILLPRLRLLPKASSPSLAH